jgi:predicted nucleic acid-binding protein
MRLTYDDKPNLSFTDLTSTAVMLERDIQDVLTGDAHVEHVGLGFRRPPRP